MAYLNEMLINSKKRWKFTLEAGRGETYAHGKPTLYGHSFYERGSVLAGRPQRVWVEQWETWEEAYAALKLVKKEFKKFKYEDFGGHMGSTHIPIEQLVAHLPEEDY